MPADIRKFLTKSTPPNLLILPPPNPIPPVVDLDLEPAAPTPPPNATSPQCPLACCDTSIGAEKLKIFPENFS